MVAAFISASSTFTGFAAARIPTLESPTREELNQMTRRIICAVLTLAALGTLLYTIGAPVNHGG